MFALPFLIALAICWHLSYTTYLASNDLQKYESMIPVVDYVPLFSLRKAIYYMESKLLYLIGQDHHEWSHARRSLIKAMHKRTQAISTIPISVNLPDSCTFRAFHFEVRSDYPRMTFEFTSRRRNGPLFIFQIITHPDQMTTVLRGRRTQQYMLSVVVPEGGTAKGIMLLVAHPNGLGIQIIVDDIDLLSTSKVLKFGKAPMDIAIYQTPNVSAVTDMYCLSPKDFFSQYPSQRGAWADIQVKIMGKSVFPMTVLNRGSKMTENLPGLKLLSKEKEITTESLRRDSTAVDFSNAVFAEDPRGIVRSAALPQFFSTFSTRRQKPRKNIGMDSLDCDFMLASDSP